MFSIYYHVIIKALLLIPFCISSHYSLSLTPIARYSYRNGCFKTTAENSFVNNHKKLGCFSKCTYICTGKLQNRIGNMTENDFLSCINKYAKEIGQIKESAHRLHEHVNQTYDKVHPYGFHLDMVVDSVYKYGHEVCIEERDVLPLFFGAYFHDSIEDARLTYNDVTKTARQWMDEAQAYMAAEIVYALTNDKGRTRAERAGERYYQGIRETPYAPFMKLADRLANITYSFTHSNESNVHMKDVYQQELPHFLAAITAQNDDIRFTLPQAMVEEIGQLIHDQRS